MGADQHKYSVPYEENINAALQKLRQSTFDSGEFSGSENNYSSLDDIFEDFELMEAGGTGTIIDVTSVSSAPELGSASPMTPEELQAVFGTQTPSEGDLEKGVDFFGSLERGECRYVVTYDNDEKPALIHFIGFTWD